MTSRDFVVAVYPVRDSEVCLIKNKEEGLWLPPGGHIEEDEIPTKAAKREVREETGLEIRLFGDKDPEGNDENVKMLKKPDHFQLEDIKPGHQHIDLVYFAEIIEEKKPTHSHEHDGYKWFSRRELEKKDLTGNVRHFGKKAIDFFQEKDST